MARRADIEGFEHDWLAVDVAGHVGFFSSAGGGVAPRAYLDEVAAFEGAIEVLLPLYGWRTRTSSYNLAFPGVP